ncbi:MAG: hypothetical protein ONB48_19340 [candidate division KSB1 bacterium]|nr:hypothetical protein [candidate division KSB1 bacterium]MDZ7274154.1 hypothetical protein [candidate division KSB1 bacterium]MDZ7287801.1 hypothetical protein [candidate division KSB1 bacterium]MDZ7296753.1 hypothetical protein [candidate division KSB1 bacterium]MDZ7347619.1 hypothetical protein [candidate division KSB1 bacterium]
MTLHLARVGGITLLMGLCMIYPFLPGEYDVLAVPLSTMVQLLGAAGLLLVPIGALWLVYEVRARAQKKRNLHNPERGYYFAIASVITASILATAVSFGVCSISIALGVLLLALWFYNMYRLLPRLRLLKKAEAENINPAPLYLLVVPFAALLFQVVLAAPLTEFSRKRAIANSNEFVRDIEAYHDRYGHYPVSLAAMWKDYYPDVVGIEKFHYSQFGESYNLFFEQPRFLFDNIGTREWVVYNPNDEHRMFSHTAWLLLLTPEELERSQGWYAVHDAKVPHWKYFWFD